ncbi:hypothetical protein ACVWZ4_004788 [Bradyrhizobium sp. USDA 4472]
MVEAAASDYPRAPKASVTDPMSMKAADYDVKYQALLVLAVLAAWGPIILINQALWDDWVLLAYSELGSFWEFFKQMGRREQFVLAAPFADLAQPRVWIIAAMVLWCAMPPLIYNIIRRVTQWSAASAFWAALLTALAPLNQARFILSTIPYTFSSLFFALGLLLLLRDLNRSSIPQRVGTVILLTMAFSTNSFLVLAWVAPAIVALAAWRETKHSSPLDQRISAMLWGVANRGELLLLPLVYWPAKQLLEPTSGLYANYNKFRMSIPAALKQTAVAFIDQFRDAGTLLPTRGDLPELVVAAAMAITAFAALAWLWRLPLATKGDHLDRPRWLVTAVTLAAAGALIIGALFPYVMVGQPPRFTGLWETRHQTTLLMVSGFVIVAVLRLIVPPRYLWRAAAAIAAVFLLLDLSFTQRLLADARETHMLLEEFAQNPSPPGTMMLVMEADRKYRAFGRFFPFYELSFLVNGGKSGPNLAISNREVLDPATNDYAKSAVPPVITALAALCESHRADPQYGFGGFTSNGQIETARLVAVGEPPGFFRSIGQWLGASGDGAIRVERETAPIGGVCRAPCCSNQ